MLTSVDVVRRALRSAGGVLGAFCCHGRGGRVSAASGDHSGVGDSGSSAAGRLADCALLGEKQTA